MIKNTCKENNLLFIDTFTSFAGKDYQKLLTPDGIHPNSEGHKFIFEIVKNELEKNNLIWKMKIVSWNIAGGHIFLGGVEDIRFISLPHTVFPLLRFAQSKPYYNPT